MKNFHSFELVRLKKSVDEKKIERMKTAQEIQYFSLPEAVHFLECKNSQENLDAVNKRWHSLNASLKMMDTPKGLPKHPNYLCMGRMKLIQQDEYDELILHRNIIISLVSHMNWIYDSFYGGRTDDEAGEAGASSEAVSEAPGDGVVANLDMQKDGPAPSKKRKLNQQKWADAARPPPPTPPPPPTKQKRKQSTPKKNLQQSGVVESDVAADDVHKPPKKKKIYPVKKKVVPTAGETLITIPVPAPAKVKVEKKKKKSAPKSMPIVVDVDPNYFIEDSDDDDDERQSGLQ